MSQQVIVVGRSAAKPVMLAKAHVKGHSRKDGTYVKPYDNKVQAKPAPVVVHHHPKPGDKGEPIAIKEPSHASAPSTWKNPHAVATFTPNGDVPLELNGVPLRQWKTYPKTKQGWDYLPGINHDLHEPPLELPKGKYAASGVVIQEPDGRVWLIAPTNAYGGYKASFPKGTAEEGLSLQGNAIKEAFEESGLQVEITGFLGDFERTTSKARMYMAKRVGGTPIGMGWESQAVHLCPKEHLYDLLNMWSDHAVAETVGAGPAPKKQPKPTLSYPSGKKPEKPEGSSGTLF